MSILALQTKAKQPDFAVLAFVAHCAPSLQNGSEVSLEIDEEGAGEPAASLTTEDHRLESTHEILLYLSRKAGLPTDVKVRRCIEKAILLSDNKEFAVVEQACNDFDDSLIFRSFLAGFEVTAADFAMWAAFRNNTVALGILKKGEHLHLARLYSHIDSKEYVKAATTAYLDVVRGKGKARANAKVNTTFELGLEHAEKGKVVTRFPPEPSGYLHIGHAKAAILNSYFAQLYEGTFLVRFDDTNPAKEKAEFETSIKEDLELLGIRGDRISYTSDYFQQIYELALKLIIAGKAYCDDTLQEQMRDERGKGVASSRREDSVEVNLQRFDAMFQGTDEGQRWCLRAKISFTDSNKAMRDPVIYRCNMEPHHRTGLTWKIYPTYDFACPVVDSLEGVTHALRTNEYRDRNPQYRWMQEAADLRAVRIWDFGRINFVYTLLSKRKLKAMVEETRLIDGQSSSLVRGWDDPRFPTVRGIRRRGMTIRALREYMLAQGPSQAQTSLEWDKIWATNKAIIDPLAPRHTAINKEQCVIVDVTGSEAQNVKSEPRPRHKKNLELGHKSTWTGPRILIEQEDAQSLAEGEEITLMDWGNALIGRKTLSEQATLKVQHMTAALHLSGDFKKTSHKVTWLEATHTVDVILLDYDYLITKKKIEDTDVWTDFINPVTEFATEAVADMNVVNLQAGDIIQFERKGYYIVDKPLGKVSRRGSGLEQKIELIAIPDGRAASVRLKAEVPFTGPVQQK